MAAIEEVRKAGSAVAGATDGSQPGPVVGVFRFVRYERSSEVKKVSESSVSYASAVAVI